MRGRFLQTIIAILVLVAQGFFDLSPVVAATLASLPPAATGQEKETVTVCVCTECRGGKHCCCKSAANPADALVLTAVCDTSQQSVQQRVLIPRLLPPQVELPQSPLALPVRTPALISLILPEGRTPNPPTHPPSLR